MLVALILAQLFCVGACTGEEGKKLIWGNIHLVKGGNYSEFEAELSRTRAQAPSEPLYELGSLLIPLAWSTDDAAYLAHVLAMTVVQFDQLARGHADEAHHGIPVSLAEDFKSGLDRLYVEHRLNHSEQRTGFAYVRPGGISIDQAESAEAAPGSLRSRVRSGEEERSGPRSSTERFRCNRLSGILPIAGRCVAVSCAERRLS